MANGWGGSAPPGVVFHYRPGRSGAHAEEILAGFEGTIQVDAYGGYDRLARNARTEYTHGMHARGARRSSWRSAGRTAGES
jgi:Transposase IS66 family